MQSCKKEIEDKALAARCISRVDKMEDMIREYRRTLDPHDFFPSVEDVLRIPDIRKVILGGSDEEFISCANTSVLPKLASRILEERTAKILALLPSDERQNDALSLATVWLKCGSCHSLMDGSSAPRHQCPKSCDWFTGEPADIQTLKLDKWAENSRFIFSEADSKIAQGLILECGEDPRKITLAEMNSKSHRFSSYEYGRLVVRNWKDTVCFASFVRALLSHGLADHTLSSSILDAVTITPNVKGGSLDRTNTQSSCTIPMLMTMTRCGAVSFVGGMTRTGVSRHFPQ